MMSRVSPVVKQHAFFLSCSKFAARIGGSTLNRSEISFIFQLDADLLVHFKGIVSNNLEIWFHDYFNKNILNSPFELHVPFFHLITNAFQQKF